MLDISAFAARVVSIADHRKSLISCLAKKMNVVAPSLSSHYPSQRAHRYTIDQPYWQSDGFKQISRVYGSILGTEKVLRVLKAKVNTPLEGKSLDTITDRPTSKFGKVLWDQVEERLKQVESHPRTRILFARSLTD